ncbi:MAG: VOC family protein [Acidimicrobiia bacterium]|nr:VOC family protein [Acidimicrobiia bacterium]
MASHKIVHWELMGTDGDKLAAFYENLFGWRSEPVTGFDSYNMVAGEAAGLGGAIGSGNEHMPSYQTFYVEVEGVKEALDAATAHGGSVAVPRTVVPGMVVFGLFTDPAGNLVGVVEAETPAAE